MTSLISQLLCFSVGVAIALGARLGWWVPPEGLSAEGLALIGVVVIMATAWLFETLPLAATALAPVVLLPALGIQPAGAVAAAYTNSTILLLMGSFFLARGVEHWQVPQRIADQALRRARGRPHALIYGLMAVTALLSMWLSNTATTLVMVTVGMAVIREAERHNPAEPVARFKLALLLGVAYAANIGGMGTPIGTAPNAVMIGMLEQIDGEGIAFAAWMARTIPLVAVLVPLVAVLLVRVILRVDAGLKLGGSTPAPRGPLPTGGRRALAAFGLTAVLWVFRKDLVLGAVTVPGWSSIGGLSGLDDASVALFGCLVMFALPALSLAEVRVLAPEAMPREQVERWLGERVLSWEVARDIPWFLLVLFGGGLALAGAFEHTGLSGWLGAQLLVLDGLPVWVIIGVLCLGMSLLTELTSNTATTTIVLPVLISAALALGMEPVVLMWPAALCASAAFILPIATPPNAIAAGAGDLSIPQMARVGVWVNVVAVVVITAWAQLILGG